MTTAPTAALRFYTVRPRRTWEITDEVTGMTVYTVTGKRRRDALMAHLLEGDPADWMTHAQRAYQWALANPFGKRHS